MRIFVLPIVFAVLAILAFGGRLIGKAIASDNAQVTAELIGGQTKTLFVVVHGFTTSSSHQANIAKTLEPHGAVLQLRYNASAISNADPSAISDDISAKIEQAATSRAFDQVYIVAHSMGSLLSRRALLKASAENLKWPSITRRIVLLAGANRGWDLTGEKPADMSTARRFILRSGYWLANMLGTSKLIFSFETGSPFVADLRLDWMQWIRGRADKAPEVVQLLGDIDDLVSRNDNQDLRTMGSGKFAFLMVRGTGHGDIVDFEPDKADRDLGIHREEKLILAATSDFARLQALSEDLPFATNPAITEVMIVLHGIRDLGRWSANFEDALSRRFPERRNSIAVVSSRYGYLGMGPFLFESVRDKYVRWFMDQYTETIARYPNVPSERIHFFGHSNGTYLLAAALDKYHAMRVGRVVFAGSVVPKAYEWSDLIDKRPQKVQSFRNYVGTCDWVVALFPRMFELVPGKYIDQGVGLGSGGFGGFDDTADNVKFVAGDHGAFDTRVNEIVDYLIQPKISGAAKTEERGFFGKLLDHWIVVYATWFIIAGVIFYVGIRIVGAAPSPSWPLLVVYGLLVVRILQTI